MPCSSQYSMKAVEVYQPHLLDRTALMCLPVSFSTITLKFFNTLNALDFPFTYICMCIEIPIFAEGLGVNWSTYICIDQLETLVGRRNETFFSMLSTFLLLYTLRFFDNLFLIIMPNHSPKKFLKTWIVTRIFLARVSNNPVQGFDFKHFFTALYTPFLRHSILNHHA